MEATLDRAWAAAVCAVCDPVFEAADVGFVHQVQADPGREAVVSLLWEADPLRFAARYPDSGIVDSYGVEQWPPHCIDYWVYVEGGTARISVEGWSLADRFVALTGDGLRDGRAIAQVVAEILSVPDRSA